MTKPPHVHPVYGWPSHVSSLPAAQLSRVAGAIEHEPQAVPLHVARPLAQVPWAPSASPQLFVHGPHRPATHSRVPSPQLVEHDSAAPLLHSFPAPPAPLGPSPLSPPSPVPDSAPSPAAPPRLAPAAPPSLEAPAKSLPAPPPAAA